MMTLPCQQRYDGQRVDETVGRLRSRGVRVGVAVNPDTDAECVGELIPKVDMILAMTVWPGFGGQKFIESVMPKVRKFRAMSEALDVEVDGGVNPETARWAAAAGANIFVAGTATFRSEDAAGAIAALRRSAIGE